MRERRQCHSRGLRHQEDFGYRLIRESVSGRAQREWIIVRNEVHQKRQSHRLWTAGICKTGETHLINSKPDDFRVLIHSLWAWSMCSRMTSGYTSWWTLLRVGNCSNKSLISSDSLKTEPGSMLLKLHWLLVIFTRKRFCIGIWSLRTFCWVMMDTSSWLILGWAGWLIEERSPSVSVEPLSI